MLVQIWGRWRDECVVSFLSTYTRSFGNGVEHLVYTSCHCSFFIASCVSVLVYVGVSLDPRGSCTCLEMEIDLVSGLY